MQPVPRDGDGDGGGSCCDEYISTLLFYAFYHGASPDTTTASTVSALIE